MEKDKLFEKYKQYFSEYTDIESNIIGTKESDSIEYNLLPIAKKIVASTIGQNLVSVNPIGGGLSSEETERIKNEVKVENRERKIESIVEDREFNEMKIEEHPDFLKSGYPSGQIFYLDFKYDNKSSEE
jgi:hypothetical protein